MRPFQNTGEQGGMQRQGSIDRYEAERGFGFIRCEGRSVFFHIRDFRAGGQPPAPGLAVVFEEIHVGTKGPRAVAVRPKISARSEPPAPRASAFRPSPRTRPSATATPRPRSSHGPAVLLMLIWAGMLVWAGWQRTVPTSLLLALPLLNLVTFMAYWLDKHAARQRRWRTSEQKLHLFAVLGGWPGAWWGQQLLRHKSVKASFRQTYWFTVFLNVAATAAWVLWRPQV
jgi:uncharacterized membrane protein YsdA (DUF1294 family)/cold shock CspA family protein